MRRRNKMALAAAVIGLTTMAFSSGVFSEDAEKLEISVTGGGEDSMQLNTATSGFLNGLVSIAPFV